MMPLSVAICRQSSRPQQTGQEQGAKQDSVPREQWPALKGTSWRISSGPVSIQNVLGQPELQETLCVNRRK